MASVWGGLAALIVLMLGTEGHWNSTAMIVVALLAYGIVSGGLSSVWAANDRRARRRQVIEDEQLRVQVRKATRDA